VALINGLDLGLFLGDVVVVASTAAHPACTAGVAIGTPERRRRVCDVHNRNAFVVRGFCVAGMIRDFYESMFWILDEQQFQTTKSLV